MRAWLWLLAAAMIVGLLAMATNVTTMAQISGEDQAVAALRKTVTKVTNAGVLWASVAVLGGWLVRRPWQAMLAGLLGLLTALAVHYGIADLTGLMPWTDLASNQEWFTNAVVFGPPLGLVGALSRRLDTRGLLARLVLPVGSLAEPFFLGMLSPVPVDIWANRVSGVVAGCLMILAGVVLGIIVVTRWRTQRRLGRMAEHAPTEGSVAGNQKRK